MSDLQAARSERLMFALVGPPEPRWKSVLRWSVGIVGGAVVAWYVAGSYGFEILALVVLVEGYKFRRLMMEREKVLDAGREWHEMPITLSIDRVGPDRQSK